jgi:hypothetical protein
VGIPDATYGICGDLRRDQEELRGFTFLGCTGARAELGGLKEGNLYAAGWSKAQELRRELLAAVRRR